MKRALSVSLIFTLALALIFSSSCFVAYADNAVFGFEQATYNVPVGKTLKIKAIAQNISGKLTYTWTSSDETIVTVKGGTIKGIINGTANVTCTATTEDGDSFSAICSLNVTIPITKLTADVNRVTLGAVSFGMNLNGDELNPYYQSKPTLFIIPETATIKTLEWSSSDPFVASVSDEGVITGKGFGKATVTAKTTDGSGKSLRIQVIVPMCYTTTDSITISEPVGATFGYIFASINGISMYNISVKGDCFSYDTSSSPAENDEMVFIKLTPVKEGSGSIIFTRNGRKIGTVKVKVEKTAIATPLQPIPDSNTMISTEFKAAMDSYEEFFDEYITFMNTYTTSDNSAAMLTDYMSMLTRYTETMEKLDAIDEDTLSPAEDAYYLEVMLRINAKLAAAI